MHAPVSIDDAAGPGLHIGAWSVDFGTNELRRGRTVVRIEPKAMDVLLLLVQRSGDVVSRGELLTAAWPGTVVGDEALTQSVIKLRRALGDNPRAPAYIETISKRGYRLIAPVRHQEAALPVPHPADPSSPLRHATQPRRRSLWAGGLAIALCALLVASVHWWGAASAPSAVDALEDGDARQPASVTITVLPFESLGPDREQAYLARGISDDLMTDLSRLAGLRVIRASAKTGDSSTPGARYRVSGSVQRDSGVLRINIHLVDTKSSEQLWSGRFERPASDLFAVQDEIIARLVALLPAKVGDAERQRLAKRYTRSLAAYDQFLRGRGLFLARGNEENEEARAFFRRALELDPDFARAYASLAMTYAMDYRLRVPAGASADLDRAFELAEAARLIDPDLPEVYWALAFVHAQSRRHEQAIQSLEQAIRLDPSFADGYALLAGIHTYIGNSAQSIPLLRIAMRLKPDGGYLYLLLLGRAYLFENDVEQALINLRAATMRNPADLEARVYLAAGLAAAGDRAAARWETDEIRSLSPGFSTPRWLETYPMTSVAQRERLAALLADAGL